MTVKQSIIDFLAHVDEHEDIVLEYILR